MCVCASCACCGLRCQMHTQVKCKLNCRSPTCRLRERRLRECQESCWHVVRSRSSVLWRARARLYSIMSALGRAVDTKNSHYYYHHYTIGSYLCETRYLSCGCGIMRLMLLLFQSPDGAIVRDTTTCAARVATSTSYVSLATSTHTHTLVRSLTGALDC